MERLSAVSFFDRPFPSTRASLPARAQPCRLSRSVRGTVAHSRPCLSFAVKVLTNRGVAFVTYVQELNAQFAKEAMMHQSLDNDEVLNVRYAASSPPRPPVFSLRAIFYCRAARLLTFPTFSRSGIGVGGRPKTRTRPRSEKSTSACSPRARRASRSRSTPSLSSACANSTNSRAKSLPLQNRRRSSLRRDFRRRRCRQRLRERRRRGSGRRNARGSRLPLRRRSSRRRLGTTTLSLLLPQHLLTPRRRHRHQHREASCPATRSRVSKSWRNCARSDCRKPKPPASLLLLPLPLPQS